MQEKKMQVNPYFLNLMNHIGHEIVCVTYNASGEEAANVSIECETCNEVLASEDRYLEE